MYTYWYLYRHAIVCLGYVCDMQPTQLLGMGGMRTVTSIQSTKLMSVCSKQLYKYLLAKHFVA